MFSPSSLEYIYTENVIMYPDLGMYLIEQGYKEPFKLTIYNDLMLGKDGVLGWMINGVTHQYQTSGIETKSAPIISVPMMFSIYIGKGSRSRTDKIAEQLQTKGLVVVAREEQKYLVPNGSEWVVPLEYLKNAKSKGKGKGFG